MQREVVDRQVAEIYGVVSLLTERGGQVLSRGTSSGGSVGVGVGATVWVVVGVWEVDCEAEGVVPRVGEGVVSAVG